MRKALLILVVAAVLAWIAFSLLSSRATRTATSRNWPAGLGTIDEVPKRFPKQPASAAALELKRLAEQAQVHRSDVGEQQLAPLRAHLLSGQPIRWEMDIARAMSAPNPNLLLIMRVHRALIRNARERARRGDAGAWDDLRASWKLTEGLWPRPELISSYIAMTIARSTLAAAREMPLPAPAWLGEMTGFDYRRAMLTALQGEAWMLSSTLRQIAEPDEGQNALRRLGEETLFAPYLELSGANLLAQFRAMVTEAAAIDRCAFDSRKHKPLELPWWNIPAQMAVPNVMAAWQRVSRMRAEVELTERALQLRRGETPSPQSQCSDGTWIVTTYSVRFSRDMPATAPGEAAVPLEFVMDPVERTGGDSRRQSL